MRCSLRNCEFYDPKIDRIIICAAHGKLTATELASCRLQEKAQWDEERKLISKMRDGE